MDKELFEWPVRGRAKGSSILFRRLRPLSFDLFFVHNATRNPSYRVSFARNEKFSRNTEGLERSTQGTTTTTDFEREIVPAHEVIG
jgi:hypothetical protein